MQSWKVQRDLTLHPVQPTDLKQGSQNECDCDGDIHSRWSALVRTLFSSFGPRKSQVRIWRLNSKSTTDRERQVLGQRAWKQGEAAAANAFPSPAQSYLLDWEVWRIYYFTLRNVFLCESCLDLEQWQSMNLVNVWLSFLHLLLKIAIYLWKPPYSFRLNSFTYLVVKRIESAAAPSQIVTAT